MAGGLGSNGLADFANTEPGTATELVADVSQNSDPGTSLGGAGLTTTFSSSPAPPSGSFLILQTGVANYLLQENGFKIKL